MNLGPAMQSLLRRAPSGVRDVGKRLLFRNRHWAHPAMRSQGVVQDLYYWICDGSLDTVMLIHNYFSVFFPHLDTRTQGSVRLYNRDGRLLGITPVDVGHLGLVKLRLSKVLQGLQIGAEQTADGTVLCHLDIPRSVREAIAAMGRIFYFWHRFYIAYSTPGGQPAYVHCVDKTSITDAGRRDGEFVNWYRRAGRYQWAPEMPLNLSEYRRFSVILVNRSPTPARVQLDVSDRDDRRHRWSRDIPVYGVRRFELTAADAPGAHRDELRMRVRGMPTPWGRPVVFKEFPNGTISVMHC